MTLVYVIYVHVILVYVNLVYVTLVYVILVYVIPVYMVLVYVIVVTRRACNDDGISVHYHDDSASVFCCTRLDAPGRE